MSQILQSKKKRFQGVAFDIITYVTDNVLVTDNPTTSPNVRAFAANLEAAHGKNYWIFDLMEEPAYKSAKFDDRVTRFPIDTRCPPPFERIHMFVLQVTEWIERTSANVAVIHCEEGLGRAGMMVACWLLQSGKCHSALQAVNLYNRMRSGGALESGQSLLYPSQERYVEYYQKFLLDGAPPRRMVKLCNIRFNSIPNFGISGGCDPWLAITRTDKTLYLSKDLRGKIGKEAVEFAIPNISLAGDVKIVVYSKSLTKKNNMFWVCLNTDFLQKGNTVAFRKPQLDKAHKDDAEKHFLNNFRVDLEFVQEEEAIEDGMCPRCQKPVSETDICVPVADAMYHWSCVECHLCHVLLSGKQCIVREGRKPTCACCEPEFFMRCGECTNILEDEDHKAVDGVFYHKECFACRNCGTPLTVDDVVAAGGSLICSEHLYLTAADTLDESNLEGRARIIYSKYVQTGARYEVNISDSIRAVLDKALADGKFSCDMFDPAYNMISDLVAKDTLPRFLEANKTQLSVLVRLQQQQQRGPGPKVEILDVIKNDKASELFGRYLRQVRKYELMMFWKDVDALHNSPSSQVATKFGVVQKKWFSEDYQAGFFSQFRREFADLKCGPDAINAFDIPQDAALEALLPSFQSFSSTSSLELYDILSGADAATVASDASQLVVSHYNVLKTMEEPQAYELLMKFMRKEMSMENGLFLRAVQQFRKHFEQDEQEHLAASKEVFRCSRCREVLKDKWVTAINRKWHPDCLRCCVCKASFGGAVFYLRPDGSGVCNPCANRNCYNCQGVISGIEGLSAMGRHYHSRCFVCVVCQKPFEAGKFRQNNSLPYCEADYQAKFAVVCEVCSKPVAPGSKVFTALSGRVHGDCFVCKICQCGLEAGFFAHENELYCVTHFTETFGGACYECGKELGDEFVELGDSKYHESCLKCSKCRVLLSSDDLFETDDGKLACEDCS